MMNVKPFTSLENRCERSLGTSKFIIYQDVLKVIKPKLFKNESWLDLASGRGDFKNFLNQEVKLHIEEADFMFGNERPFFHGVNLNLEFDLRKQFDVVSVIEALHFFENPRHLIRGAYRHLSSGGMIVVTIPNLHSITSLLSLTLRGSHSAFYGPNYPSHITPIHMIDMERILIETGFKDIQITPVSEGRIPGLKLHWQDLPFGKSLFKSMRFSDNLIFVARKD